MYQAQFKHFAFIISFNSDHSVVLQVITYCLWFFFAIFHHFFYSLYLIYVTNFAFFIHIFSMSLFLEYNNQRAGSSCFLFHNLVVCWFDLIGLGPPCCTTQGYLFNWWSVWMAPPAAVQCTDKLSIHIGPGQAQLDILLNWKTTLHKNWWIAFLLVCCPLADSELLASRAQVTLFLPCLPYHLTQGFAEKICANGNYLRLGKGIRARWFGHPICTLLLLLIVELMAFLHHKVKEISLNTFTRR